MRLPTIVWAVSLLAACVSGAATQKPRGKFISPSEQGALTEWSDEERQRPVAMRNLRRSPEASFHLMRIAGERRAHVHEQSDLVFMMLAGDLQMALGDQTLTLKPGDVVEIPRGMPYDLHNRGREPSVAYLVYTPPLRIDDQKPVSGSAPTESVWKWNLWLQ